MTQTGGHRIAGLDAWRSMLMLAGLFVHGSAWLPSTPLFFAVEVVSQAFRMGVFFALSGFLAAMALRRSAPGPWLAGRLRQLGVPAMTGVLLLSPLDWWLAVTRPGGSSGNAPLVFEWAHTWFLWGLLVCSAVLWRLDRSARTAQLISVAQTRRPSELILMTAIATLVLFAIVPPVLMALLPPRIATAYCNVQLIAGYLPTFLFGVLLARSQAIREQLLDEWRLCGGIVGVAAVFYTLLCLGLIDLLEQYVRFIGAAICPPAAFVLILRSALQIRYLPAAVRSLSDGSYTIYLLHVPAAVAINTRMAPLQLHPNLQFAVTIVCAGVGCWLFHITVVRRSTTAALLLNGRLKRQQSPASAPLAGHVPELQT